MKSLRILKKILINRSVKFILIPSVFMGCTSISSETIAVPNQFQAGQPASSAAINENFAHVESLIEAVRNGPTHNAAYRDIDCTNNPAAIDEVLINEAPQETVRYLSISINFTGDCVMPRGYLNEPGKELYLLGTGPQSSSLTGSFDLSNHSLIWIANTRLENGVLKLDNHARGYLESVSATDFGLEATFNSTLSVQQTTFSTPETSSSIPRILANGNSSLSLNNVNIVSEPLAVMDGSVLSISETSINSGLFIDGLSMARAWGSIIIGASGNADTALSIKSGSYFDYRAGNQALTINGSILVQKNATFYSNSPVSVNVGTVFVDTKSHLQMWSHTLTITKGIGSDGLGRGLVVERGSSAQFWSASLVMQGFNDSDSTVNLKNGSSAELRGGGPVRSQIPGLLVTEGSVARILETDIVSSYIDMNSQVTFSGSIGQDFNVSNSDVVLADTTFLPQSSLQVRNSTVSISGPAQPDISRVTCLGNTVLDYNDGTPINGQNGCFNTSAWNSIMQNFAAPTP